jgi:hypothetical protein
VHTVDVEIFSPILFLVTWQYFGDDKGEYREEIWQRKWREEVLHPHPHLAYQHQTPFTMLAAPHSAPIPLLLLIIS